MSTPIVLVLLDDPASLSIRTLELLTAARGLGRLEALCVGEPTDAVLDELGNYGVRAVHRPELAAGADPRLTPVLGDVVAAAVAATGAGVVLLTSTFANKEVAARAAFAAGAGLVTDASGLTTGTDGRLCVSKQVFAGTWDTTVEVTAPVAVVTVRANAVVAEPALTAGRPVVETYPAPVADTGVRIVERVEHERSGPALADAAAVVAGGRGTGGDFGPVLDLADALGAAVGATRDATLAGWYPEYIGQTGVTIAPRVYIAAGISGAPYHMAGVQSSQYIVAVNEDPECPMFELSDFAVVGDLATVLRQAAAAIREYRARA